MRIAYITHYAELYGANRSMLDLLLELRRRGAVEPFVILPREGPLSERLEAEHVPTTVIPFQPWMSDRHYMGRAHHRIGQHLRYERSARARAEANERVLPQAARQILQWHADAVHVNSAAVGIAPGLKAMLSIPMIWHIRELPERQYLLHIDAGRRTYGAALRAADRRIAISEAVRHDILRYTRRSVPVDLVYNGVLTMADYRILGERAAERWQNTKPFTFLIAGLIHPSKGQDEAVQALDIVRRSAPEVKLIVAGDGKVDQLRALIEQLGLAAWVELPGFVPDMRPIFLASHALLMCSRNEAMGRVTVEAMGSGLPVIGHASGGTPELIREGENGMLYPGGAEELAARMIRLVRDPAMARTIGDRALRMAAERFSVERMADEVLAIYREVLPRT